MTNGNKSEFKRHIGELAEWSNAAVLKTVDLHGSGGSNPSLSAEKGVTDICSAFFNFRVTKNVTKISVRPIFHSKEMQVESGDIFYNQFVILLTCGVINF